MSTITGRLNFYSISMDETLNFIGTSMDAAEKIKKMCSAIIWRKELVYHPQITADLWLMIAMCDYEQQSYVKSYVICRNIIKLHKNDTWICMIASSIAALCLNNSQNFHLARTYAQNAMRFYDSVYKIKSFGKPVCQFVNM